MSKISERNASGFDHLSIYRWHASAACKWALSLVSPSIRAPQEPISSLWFWRVCICSVCSLISLFLIGCRLEVRVSVTLSGIKDPSLLFFGSLIHPLLVPTCPSISFFPQALPFICLSSADSLHPSLQPRPSLWSSLFHFLPHLLFCLPLSLLCCPLNPVDFSLGVSTAHLFYQSLLLSLFSTWSPSSDFCLILIHPLFSTQHDNCLIIHPCLTVLFLTSASSAHVPQPAFSLSSVPSSGALFSSQVLPTFVSLAPLFYCICTGGS